MNPVSVQLFWTTINFSTLCIRCNLVISYFFIQEMIVVNKDMRGREGIRVRRESKLFKELFFAWILTFFQGREGVDLNQKLLRHLFAQNLDFLNIFF